MLRLAAQSYSSPGQMLQRVNEALFPYITANMFVTCFYAILKNGGYEATVEEMEARIVDVSDIEGVTFLGGEPFEQAEALADLGRRVRRAGLSVMTFTGYVLEDILKSSRQGWHDLLAVTDLHLDGPTLGTSRTRAALG